MAIAVLLIVAAALGAYGYFRGASRFLLSLLPLILASLLLWLVGSTFYRIDALRGVGLVWPPAVLVILGASAGSVLLVICKKGLSKKIHRADRIGGCVLGVLISIAVVWLGCVYLTVWSATRAGDRGDRSAARLAQLIDTVFLRWIPVVGSGSTAVMDLLEISTADDEVRQRALQDLAFDRLLDVPQVRAVLDAPEIQEDVEAAAGGSIPAMWRLQKNPKILELVESEEFRETIDSHSLHEIVEAVRKSKQEAAGEP